jgi:hypothetical protein
VTLQDTAFAAARVARVFFPGTPVRAEIEARGDLAETTAEVEALVCAALGSGPVTGDMTAYVVVAAVQ